MKSLAALLVLAACVNAATVQGVIFDEETANPIARSEVSLVPLPGTKTKTVTVLADDHGRYAFSSVPPGWYIVRVSRIGFETGEFGQLRPGLPGKAFEVKDGSDDNQLRQILMRRQAAISGSVVDDNNIGIPDWGVSVYTARPPVERIAGVKTNDRGEFRVGELERGWYIVRASGGQLEDQSELVPAYYKYGTALAGAQPIFVRLGETASFTVIHTVAGQLFDLSGQVVAPDDRPISIALISDSGRRTISAKAGPFLVSGLAPGKWEILAQGAGCGSYQTQLIDRNAFARVECNALSAPVIAGAESYPVYARRADLDGPGDEFTLKGEALAPGPWEFLVRPSPGQYLVSIRNEQDDGAPPLAQDGWFSVEIGTAPRLKVNLSNQPASISGTVTALSMPVTGAPVFLQLLNPLTPELALQSWETRADAQGHYVFNSLPPGDYRLMSSYALDYDEPVAKEKSAVLHLTDGESAEQPLELLQP
ncbi:MAG TPA: carboxypeptidase regulatory-like domain-containing protein [Bryobacteraceae bacterium]|nr:carboxypeptidase regulatory-like domain-containing protein [Bryobacteraceae bacterium]